MGDQLDERISGHYGWSGLMEAIADELRGKGIDPERVTVAQLAPADNYHWHRLAGILDARLAKSKWLVGDNVTIADIAVAAPMHVYKWQRLPLNDHPNLKRWMADVEQLPCWQKTQGAVERALRLE